MVLLPVESLWLETCYLESGFFLVLFVTRSFERDLIRLFIVIFFPPVFSPRCLDILELSELEDLRKFHYHTLKLYCALCALGNTRVAHALCSHLDQSQLLYTIDNQYLSGMLREGFYNVLIRLVALPAK